MGWLRRNGVNILLVLLGCLATSLLAARLGPWVWRRSPVFLTITGGDPEGLRQRFAERIAAASRNHPWLRLTAVPTEGTEDAVERIQAGKLDLVLGQGGFRFHNFPDLRELAAGPIEPLHLLVKQDLEGPVRENFAALKGKRIDLGPAGSGTAILAREVIKFEELSDFHAEEDTTSEALLPREGQEPDAIFIVSPLPSPVAQSLVDRLDYRLIPLPYSRAFALSAEAEEAQPPPPPDDSAPRTLVVDKRRIIPTTIPAYCYRRSPDVPKADLPTLGTRMLLIGHEGLENDVVDELLGLIDAAHILDLAEPDSPELSVHPEARDFFDRRKPILTANVLDLLDKVFSILVATITLAGTIGFPLITAYRVIKRRKAERFEDYIARVAKVERKALEAETSSGQEIDRLRGLQRELSALKADAVEKFAEGAIADQELMMGFLAQVNDARDNLTRLILHQREMAADRKLHEALRPEATPLLDRLLRLSQLGIRAAALASRPDPAAWESISAELSGLEKETWEQVRPDVPEDRTLACELLRGANSVRVLLALVAPQDRGLPHERSA